MGRIGHFFRLSIPTGAGSNRRSGICTEDVDETLIAVPSHAFASVLKQSSAILSYGSTLSWANQGITAWDR